MDPGNASRVLDRGRSCLDHPQKYEKNNKALRSPHVALWCNVVHPSVWAGPGWDARVSQSAPWGAKMHPMPFWLKILEENFSFFETPSESL